MQSYTIVRTPTELCKAIDRRRRELGLTMLQLDDCAGLQSGYAAKVLGPAQVKRFGEMSLPATLGALGLELIAIRAGKSEPLQEINILTLLRFPQLREALSIEVALVADDALVPAVTRRIAEGSLSVRKAHAMEGAVRRPAPLPKAA